MEIYRKFVTLLETVPAYVPLIILPALCVVAVALFGFLGGRKFYPAICAVLGAAGFALLSAQDTRLALVYAGLFAVWGVLWGLLLRLPKLKKRARKLNAKADKMYEKFHQELSVPAIEEKKPQKVCCFEETPAQEAQLEKAPQLDHADALLKKLGAAKLSPGDRLETDALKRKLDLYRNKPLTQEEARSLNDCLSSVLKLTAKYKL